MTEENTVTRRPGDVLDVGAPTVEEADAHRERDGDSPLARPGVSPEALRDLALAFRTSAEAIEGVRELQAELVGALKRQDRSELVLRSTDALNETFRNLTLVQREILDRLDADRRTGPGRAVPLMLIGLLVVFLGGIYAVVTLVEQLRDERRDGAEVVQLATTKALAAFKQGLEDSDGHHTQEVERLQKENADVRQRAEALLARLDKENVAKSELQEEKQSVELELESMGQRMLKAQNEVMAKRALEDELRAASGQVAVMEPKLRALEMELQTERDLNTRLRKRLAALGYGLPDPEAKKAADGDEGSKSDAETAGADAEPGASAGEARPPAADRQVERDSALLAKIQTRLNQILDAGSASKTSFWQIDGIEGVTPKGLVGVDLSLLSRQHRRLIQEVRTGTLRFWVDRDQRLADMVLGAGTIRDARGQKAIPDGGMTFRVATGEMFRLWSQSGLVFVQFR